MWFELWDTFRGLFKFLEMVKCSTLKVTYQKTPLFKQNFERDDNCPTDFSVKFFPDIHIWLFLKISRSFTFSFHWIKAEYMKKGKRLFQKNPKTIYEAQTQLYSLFQYIMFGKTKFSLLWLWEVGLNWWQVFFFQGHCFSFLE